MIIPVKTRDSGYDIILEKGILKKTGELSKILGPAGVTLIVTDDGVPQIYSKVVADACAAGGFVATLTLPQGEKNKSMDTLKRIFDKLVELHATRKDRLIAVGGGVGGDMTGLAAALYMRGIDWINIPTTVLSQVDSSVGGKTAIDYAGVKNVIGAFYPPKMVIIDQWTLSTLPKRQIGNGLAEALKMSLTSDEELFRLFENEDPFARLDEIIVCSVQIKKAVVELGEKEAGLRRILNFGHTIGHAIEKASNFTITHGQAVAIGMVQIENAMFRLGLAPKETFKATRDLVAAYRLPVKTSFTAEELYDTMTTDKKRSGDMLRFIVVKEIGACEYLDVAVGEAQEGGITLRNVLEEALQ